MAGSNLKYLKELAHGAGFTFIFGLIGFGLMFLFKLIAARYYGPDDFGLFSLSETILGICVLFAGMGISAGITRYYSTYDHNKNNSLLQGYLRFVLIVPVTLSLLVTILLFIFSNHVAALFGFPVIFSKIILIVSLIVPIRVISGILRPICLSNKKYFFYNFSYNIIEKFLLLFGVVLIFLFKLSIIYLLWVFLIATFTSFIFDIYIYNKKIKPDFGVGIPK